MKILGLSTGFAELKTAFVAGSPAAGGALPFLWKVRRDRWFGSPVPILTWLLDTGTERILIDTGDRAPSRQGGPSDSRFTIRLEEEIGPLLRQAGYDPQDITKIVLTHLHQDHVGGLHHFPQTPVLVCREEWNSITRFPGSLIRSLTAPVPKDFAPVVFDFLTVPYGPFARSYPLTADGAVLAVPTPGHSIGHLSIIIRAGAAGNERDLFLAGDVTYDGAALRHQIAQGFVASPQRHRQTLDLVRGYVENSGAVYLPSHDREALKNLAQALASSTAVC